MQNKGIKVVAATLASIIIAGGYSMETKASGIIADMPGAGISVVLNDSILSAEEEKAEEKTEQSENKKKEENTTELVSDTEQASTSVAENEAPTVENEYADIAIAQVSNYVNLRSLPSEEGEILGKLYNNSAATILAVEGDWYKIKSGSVDGYVKAEFVVSGAEAAELAKEVGHRVATVNTETLKVRNDAGLEATVQTLIPEGETYEVVEELDGWVKIAVDTDIEGFVSAEYVNLETEFVEAESIEEEKARLAEEERIRKEAEEAARRADEEAKNKAAKKKATESAQSAESTTSTESSSSEAQASAPAVSAPASGSRASIVNYALQFVGNPYVAGGTSLTSGADCSGFTQSVFRDCGISIPRDSRSQAAGGTEVALSAIQPGDLLFYSNGGSINHVALYIGNGQVVHASTAKTGIKISSYNYRTPCKAVTYVR